MNYFWPLKIYFFDVNGKYFKNEVLTMFDEKQLKSNSHHIKHHMDKQLEVMICDVEEYAVFHAKHGKIIYPTGVDNQEYFIYSNPIAEHLRQKSLNGLWVPVYKKDGAKKWVLRKNSKPMPYEEAVVWYKEWLKEQYDLGLNEERKLVKAKKKN